MKEVERFDRYYYPVERFDPSAIAVNGLTGEIITARRGEATYPKYFTEDPSFEQFCSGVRRFVAHNLSFDTQFIPFIGDKKKFCTMITNMDIVAVDFLKWRNQWKWPKLSETAVHYGISFSENDLHGSMKDTEITAEIFRRMLQAARLV
jgi:DNA polymerase-3 subunit epsilon